MKKEIKNNLKKAQLFIIIAAVLTVPLFFFKNSEITGHFSADFKSQILDIEIDQSQSYSLAADNINPIYISSLRLSGNIIGYGSVEIYIEDQSQKFLIYKNIREKEKGITTITGMATVEAAEEEIQETALLISPLEPTIRWDGRPPLNENEEYVMGVFNNKCEETCYMEMPVSSQDKYKLIFMIEPGTKVEISKLIYTIKEE